MKKHLSVLFMLMLVGLLTLAACGDDSTEGGSDNNDSDNNSEEKGSDEPVKLTFFSIDGSEKTFDDPVAQKLTEETGVILEMDYPVGGTDEAIPLMIAGGEYPDMIFAKGDLSKLIEAGGVIKLDDMIEERGDNLKAMYGEQIDRLRNSLEDPSIYQVGTYGVNDQVLQPSGSFQIQLDVLRELGYPEINTLAEFESALTEYYEKYPEINGQKTIPLSLQGSDWRWLVTVGNPAGWVAGFPDDGQWHVDNDTGDTQYKFILDEYREYFKWLNGMNAKGLLDPESFTHTQETYISKISTGRVLSVADQNWNIGDARSALIQSDMEERLFAPLPVVLEEGRKHQALKNYGFAGGWGIAISSTSEHPEKAFDFLDYIASEEGQILVNWGVEGEHYEVVDGKRVMFDDVREKLSSDSNYTKESGVGYYIYPFPNWGSAAVDSNGQSISINTKEDVMADLRDAEKETLDQYGMELWTDWFPAQDELEMSNHGAAYNISIPAGSDIQIIKQRADDITEQRITEAILADPDEFDGLWDQMLQELDDAGVEQLNEDMTELVKNIRELWGTN